MKNAMNYRCFATLTGMIAASLLVGCHPAAKMHGEDFTADGAQTSTGRMAQAQCANGAREDAMLYDRNFKGAELNSLGEGKLDLILKATPTGEPVYIYLNMPHDQVVARQVAVTGYLKTAGVTETKIIVAEGPNPNLTIPTAYNLEGLYKPDGSSFSGAAAVDTSISSGASSSSAGH